jgi:hypothetical protein
VTFQLPFGLLIPMNEKKMIDKETNRQGHDPHDSDLATRRNPFGTVHLWSYVCFCVTLLPLSVLVVVLERAVADADDECICLLIIV